ncbi:hypothetical protein MP638_002172 [Amoeboaphelidium occidentale]|nr:hypothetical protein MP638_002172 [Amoeboaphelidium occidentale]
MSSTKSESSDKVKESAEKGNGGIVGKRGLKSSDVALIAVAVAGALVAFAWNQKTYNVANVNFDIHFEPVYAAIGLLVSFILLLVSWVFRSAPVYLLDFAICQGKDSMKVPYDLFMERSRGCGKFTEENVEFQGRILARSGVGPNTYFPDGIVSNPPDLSMESARKEFEFVMTSCLDDLFSRTKLRPQDIDILIVNCSLFNPTPSLAAMVINKYKMKSSIKSYNLAGMGCSAGVIAIDLAKDLLQVHRNSRCVVISTENITQNWYLGNDRSMLLSNCLFRTGGAAVLLSNKWTDHFSAKYKLMHTVRVCKAADDEAYRAVFQTEDDQNIVGVRLSKQLIKCVGDALKTNLTRLGPLVLPFSEQLKFALNSLWRTCEKVIYGKASRKPYTPDFKKSFEHICIHSGGRAVIDGLQENLDLSDTAVKASRAVLWRYGNTSSSSIWYELAYHEQTGNIKSGDRVWQIAFGSGLKCNSAVWKSMKSVHDKKRGDWNLDGSDIKG